MPTPRPLPSPRAFVTAILHSLSAAGTPDLAALTAAPDALRKLLVALHVLFPGELLPALDLLDRGLVMRLVVASASADDASTATATDDTLEPSSTRADTDPDPDSDPAPLFYVRSAAPRRSRFAASPDSRIAYEVRLRAWNCTCPAFAFAAFAAMPAAGPGGGGGVDGADVEMGTGTGTAPAPATVAQLGISNDTPPLCGEEVQGQDPAPFVFAFGGRYYMHEMETEASTDSYAHEPMPPVCKHMLACVLAEQCGGAFACAEQRVGAEEAAGWAAGWGDN